MRWKRIKYIKIWHLYNPYLSAILLVAILDPSLVSPAPSFSKHHSSCTSCHLIVSASLPESQNWCSMINVNGVQQRCQLQSCKAHPTKSTHGRFLDFSFHLLKGNKQGVIIKGVYFGILARVDFGPLAIVLLSLRCWEEQWRRLVNKTVGATVLSCMALFSGSICNNHPKCLLCTRSLPTVNRLEISRLVHARLIESLWYTK